MNYYSLTTQFEFGKHFQKTLEEVLNIEKSYVEWCLIYLEDFCFDAFLVNDFSSGNVNLSLSEEALTALSKKLAPQNNSKANSLYEDDDDYESDDFDNYEEGYGRSGEKYGWYNGFSDDVIDDAFEGEPSNTWNVD
jgi:hypothetical protein